MNEPQSPGDSAWMNARPKLRADLVFAPRLVRDQPGYTIEDNVRGKFYRLGLSEYGFVAALDGETTVREALQQCAGHAPERALSVPNAIGLLNWLAATGLLEQSANAAARSSQRDVPRARWWLNPIFIRVPLIAPDRMLDRLLPACSWVASTWMITVTVVLVAFSSLIVLPNMPGLFRSMNNIYSAVGTIGLVVSWVLLKIIHELGHGLVCRRYGASAREAGVMLLLFLPIPYIDVTSSWRLRDRRHRIHIAGAGMLVELLAAALAAFVWMATSPGAVNQIAANVVVMASFTTVLFNANPLMRFDGYYILSDLLDVPNLYGQSQAWLRSSLRRYVLGLPTAVPRLPSRLAGLMRAYAVAAFLWRLSVCVGLIVAAALLWEGAGIVLAALACVMWFAVPVVRWVRTNFTGAHEGSRPSALRLAAVFGGFLFVVAIIGTCVPWPGANAAPAVVDYAPLHVVRAPSDAWVEGLYVLSGQYVAEGQVLAETRNDNLDLEIARLDIEIQQAKMAILQYEQKQQLAAAQAEGERLTGLLEQRAELDKQRQRMRIRAPAAGRIVSPRVSEKLGTYLRQGDELLQIADDRKKEVRVAATQDELPQFARRIGQPVRVSTSDGRMVPSRLDRIKPRASTRPLHPALTAVVGGPLTVQRVHQDRREDSDEDVELLKPHFEAVIPLAPNVAEELRAGQTVTVFLDGSRDSLGGHVVKMVKSWFRTRTQ